MVAAETQSLVPGYQDLMWPAIKALKAMGGSASNDELLAKVIEIENIPEDIQGFIHTDNRQTKVSYNLAWAKTYLKRVGALENSARGLWALTAIGEAMTEQDCKDVPRRVRREDHKRKRAPGERPADSSDAFVEAPLEETWKDALIHVLLSMKPDAFERLAQRILREAGFIKVAVTGRGGDGGIDGLGVLRVNLLSFQVLFQCKRYQGTVGAGTVRDFRGAMVGRCDKGLIITTGTFSNDAKREATRDGAPAIDLIDGDFLCDLLKQLKLGITTEMIEKIIVDASWFGDI
ncbi:MAG: restriction endonuclease [Stellaceae bacterium]